MEGLLEAEVELANDDVTDDMWLPTVAEIEYSSYQPSVDNESKFRFETQWNTDSGCYIKPCRNDCHFPRA